MATVPPGPNGIAAPFSNDLPLDPFGPPIASTFLPRVTSACTAPPAGRPAPMMSPAWSGGHRLIAAHFRRVSCLRGFTGRAGAERFQVAVIWLGGRAPCGLAACWRSVTCCTDAAGGSCLQPGPATRTSATWCQSPRHGTVSGHSGVQFSLCCRFWLFWMSEHERGGCCHWAAATARRHSSLLPPPCLFTKSVRAFFHPARPQTPGGWPATLST